MRTKRSVLLPSFALRRVVAGYLAEDELKLYRLIWMRFVASQMTPAVFDQTTIEVQQKARTTASIVSAPRDPCRSSTASWLSTKKARIRRTRTTRS